MKYRTLLYVAVIVLCIGCAGPVQPTAAQNLSTPLDVSGYINELGGVSFDNRLHRFRYDNILQNRLETEWNLSSRFEGQLDMRNRLLSGYTVRNQPGYARLLDQDSGYLDMSWTPLEGEQHIWHLHIDRLSLSYFSDPIEVRFGRHRLNWSRTFVWSPNDLFNNFAYLDFDYEERPGTDALSFRYNWSYASGLELAYNPADTFEKSVIGAMVRESYGSYDIQLIGGYYRDKLALGGGLSGYLGGAGLKGEVTYFQPAADLLDQSGTVNATVGLDYMLPSSLYLRGEILYNGGWNGSRNPLSRLTQPPRADNLFIAHSAIFIEGSYPLHPLIDVSLGGMASFDRSIYVIMPRISVSASDDIDLMLLSQLFKGDILQSTTQTPNHLFGRVRWSF